jgi:DNA invertase Pin-like site-specific DNA recombinase
MRSGHEIVQTFEEYVSAFSGSDRFWFKAALEALNQDGEFMLVVNDLTRLGRDLADYGEWKKYLPMISSASMGVPPHS